MDRVELQLHVRSAFDLDLELLLEVVKLSLDRLKDLRPCRGWAGWSTPASRPSRSSRSSRPKHRRHIVGVSLGLRWLVGSTYARRLGN